MSSWRRSGAAVRLLAVLCLTVGCAAIPQHEPTSIDNGPTNKEIALPKTTTAKTTRAPQPPAPATQPPAPATQPPAPATQPPAPTTQPPAPPTTPGPQQPRDCSDLPAGTASGVYNLTMIPGGRSVPAYCDMDTDGGNWTVFQRRDDDVANHRSFYRRWRVYEEGFGDLREEFWLGLKYLASLTSRTEEPRQYELRVDLEDFKGNTSYAVYQRFQISFEADGYRLSVYDYDGTAGDSLDERYHHHMEFSTHDRGPEQSCAVTRHGAWWYPRFCGVSNLNGRYLNRGYLSFSGIFWVNWKGLESLKKTEMKMRPVVSG